MALGLYECFKIYYIMFYGAYELDGLEFAADACM